MTEISISERIHTAASFIESKLGGRKIAAGIILGSGLGSLADSITDSIVIPYSSIPCFAQSTAIGHKGNMIIGYLGGKCVMAMQGRFHYYEGHAMNVVTMGVRIMKLLGAEYLFVSCAAGACNPDYHVGDLVILKDHINMLPNPLIGPNLDEFGPRFPDMTCPYDRELRRKAHSFAAGMGLTLAEGVYYSTTGPSYETPAEILSFRKAGADLVGMSTTPEVIVARHCGLRVFGISVVTNISNTSADSAILNDGHDVVLQADKAAKRMCSLLSQMISTL